MGFNLILVLIFLGQVVAVADQSAPATTAGQKEKEHTGTDGLGHQRAGGIRGAFDSRAVASATLDVMDFILSGEGSRVRVLLVKDIVRTCSTVLRHYYLDIMKLENNPIFSEYVGESLKSEPAGNPEVRQNAENASKWKDIASSLYGDSVFANPLSWSKARFLRIWGGRQGTWSSSRKDTEASTSSGERPENAGQRAHSHYPRALNLGPLHAEKTYRFRAENQQATPKVEMKTCLLFLQAQMHRTSNAYVMF